MNIRGKIHSWFYNLFQNIGKHLLSIVFVIIVYIVFRMPQINDSILIMIQKENHIWTMTRFYVFIVVFAYLIANSHLLLKSENRTTPIKLKNGIKGFIKSLLFNIKPEDPREQQLVRGAAPLTSINQNTMEVLFPKLLATLFIVSIAFAVDTAYFEFYGYNILLEGHWAFIIISVLLILATSNTIAALTQSISNETINKVFPILVVIICVVFIAYLGFKNQGGRQEDFRNLFYSVLALAILFYTLSITYHSWLLKLKEYAGLIFGLMLITLTMALYIVLWAKPDFNLGNPLNVILVCLIGLFMFLMGCRILGSYIELPILPVILIGAIFSTIQIAKSKNFTHYEVEKVKTTFRASHRMSLDDYADRWVNERLGSLDTLNPNKPFPIILVSSEGGGSRAGHWSLLVQSYLYKHYPNYFHKHLFSLTGASGGSVGNAIFHTVALENSKKRDTSIFSCKDSIFKFKASHFYSHDYLSASVASLLGNDLLASVTTKHLSKDRGNFLDSLWQESFKEYFGFDGLSAPFLKKMPNKDEDVLPPLLVINTTKVQNGKLNVMSNVKFESIPLAKVQSTNFQFEDLLELMEQKHTDATLKRSSAMRINASFPYVSPNARISGVGQFGDSGYYDNVGGVITRQMENALLAALKRADIKEESVEIIHLIFTNNTKLEEMCCDIEPKEKDSVPFISQLLSPGKMVLKATFAHPSDFIDAASDSFRIESERTKIKPAPKDMFFGLVEQDSTKYCPIIPLGRYMSKDALRSLEQRLKEEEVASKLEALLNKMKSTDNPPKYSVSL